MKTLRPEMIPFWMMMSRQISDFFIWRDTNNFKWIAISSLKSVKFYHAQIIGIFYSFTSILPLNFLTQQENREKLCRVLN